ncbi:MAG TPA: NADP oxidoreductase, partial [Solirubrobacteraceae bacterium]|nr:NADP oxidoreductase [Solirubrobacteraceae bacterium]
PELLELGELSAADVIVDPDELAMVVGTGAAEAATTARRNVEILREYAVRPPQHKARRVTLRFLLSPVAIEGSNSVERVVLARNELVSEPDGSMRARATDERIVVPSHAVFRAIGYRGTPLAGVPFDEHRGVIANTGGRVVAPEGVRHGEYVVGWAKRGPSGVIGTNKKDANDTVARLLEDFGGGRLLAPAPISDAALDALIRERAPNVVDYAGWARIDRHERERGESQGRPRIKLTRVQEMLAAAKRR